jgi:hypothetical protein
MLLYTPTTAGDIALASERRDVEIEAAAKAKADGDLDAAAYHTQQAGRWLGVMEALRREVIR